jgi:hypothetical protein
MLKPSLTFSDSASATTPDSTSEQQASVTEEQSKARGALEMLEESLSTPAKERYDTRLKEGYDLEGESPCFDVYKKLHKRNFQLQTLNHIVVLNFLLMQPYFGRTKNSLVLVPGVPLYHQYCWKA